MHLPEEFLFDTVFNLRRILKSGGRLLISTPLTGPSVDPSTLRDPDGRLFNGVTPENFHFLLEKVGFRRISRWDEEDSLGRTDRRWSTQLFVLESQGSRSLDQIESILNRDKKDATYKPALFRPLAELATTSYHAAKWLLLNASSVRQVVPVAGAGTGEQRRDGPGRFCGYRTRRVAAIAEGSPFKAGTSGAVSARVARGTSGG